MALVAAYHKWRPSLLDERTSVGQAIDGPRIVVGKRAGPTHTSRYQTSTWRKIARFMSHELYVRSVVEKNHGKERLSITPRNTPRSATWRHTHVTSPHAAPCQCHHSPARHVIIHLLQEGSDERREAYLRLGLIGCNLKRAGVAEESGQLHSRLDRMHRVLTMRKDEDR